MYKSPSKKSRQLRCAAPSYRPYLLLQGLRCEAPGMEVGSTEEFLFNWGDASGMEVCSTELRHEASWIEVCSTESRREAPWIEVRSTELFLFN